MNITYDSDVPTNDREYLIYILKKCKKQEFLYAQTAIKYNRCSLLLTIPSIILNSVLLVLNIETECDSEINNNIVTGGLVLNGILFGLNEYLKCGKKQEYFKNKCIEYKTLSLDIEEILLTNSDNTISRIKNKYIDIVQSDYIISDKLYKLYEKEEIVNVNNYIKKFYK